MQPRHSQSTDEETGLNPASANLWCGSGAWVSKPAFSLRISCGLRPRRESLGTRGQEGSGSRVLSLDRALHSHAGGREPGMARLAGRHRARGWGWGVPRPKSERPQRVLVVAPPLTLRMLINQAANRWPGRGAPLRQSGGHASGRAPGRPWSAQRVKAWVEENRGSFLPPVSNKLL